MKTPRPDIVDYFPEFCTQDTIEQVLDGRFGNDGLAFWLRLRQWLGRIPGYAMDLGPEDRWQLAISNSRMTEERLLEVLGVMVRIGAIDRGLWEGSRVIWSDPFIKSISHLYAKRVSPLPMKPADPTSPMLPFITGAGKAINSPVSSLPDNKGLTGSYPEPVYPHRIGKERKGKDLKIGDGSAVPDPTPPSPSGPAIKPKTLTFSEAVDAYRDTFNLTPSPEQRERITRQVDGRLGEWKVALSRWKENNYSPRNVAGLLDSFNAMKPAARSDIKGSGAKWKEHAPAERGSR